MAVREGHAGQARPGSRLTSRLAGRVGGGVGLGGAGQKAENVRDLKTQGRKQSGREVTERAGSGF